ncbi:MAG TPA: response regulator [Reyranella sp.]|nr:response regulator [Reyranella sp.]
MSAAFNLEEEDRAEARAVVLVVEDEILVRLTIAAYLRDCGYEVLEAGHAGEAIRVLEAGLLVDAVFSDVNMPGGMDGFGLAAWISAHRPYVKIMLTSGHPRNLADEGPSVLAKPYRYEEVARRLDELLKR